MSAAPGRFRLRILPAAALAALAAIPAAPAAPPGGGGRPPRLAALFPNEAPVEVAGGRLARLELPPEVLAACRPDLSDLRLFDAEGREVPFLVDGGWAPDRRLAIERRVTLEPAAADRHRTDSETGPPLWRESFTLDLPADLPAGVEWQLELVSARATFVKRVDVTAIAEGGERGQLVAGGSVFRLAAPGRERTAVPLPTFSARRLVVVLEGEDGGYLEPVFRLATGREVAARDRTVVPLAEVARRDDGERTVVDLVRPRGLVPDALRLTTTTGAFSRPLEVWDEGPGSAGSALARGTLFRLQALTVVEEVELPLAPARGDQLRVVIADGDSPPLADLAFAAVVRRPAMLFILPAPAEGIAGPAAATLRFGGARAFRPRYDLAGLPPALVPAATGAAAEIAERLYDPAQVAAARLGPISANPGFDPTPALAFAQHPGAELDARLFRFRRPLAARPSAEGLVRLPLAPDDLAHARPDLADLRLADASGRQWAYLLERDAGEGRAALAIGRPESRDGTSSYRLELPARPATVARIVLDIDAPYFDRAFTLAGLVAGRRNGEEAVLIRGRLVRRAGDPRPVTLAFPSARLERLELSIEDGDDAPLDLTGAEAVLPLPDLYFAAPAGAYALLLGDPEAEPPRYELARVRDVVLAVAAGDAETGPLADNPDFSRRARLATAPGLQRVLLWIALGLAVAVLAGLTLKLARRG